MNCSCERQVSNQPREDAQDERTLVSAMNAGRCYQVELRRNSKQAKASFACLFYHIPDPVKGD
jgi:hypothetical protein